MKIAVVGATGLVGREMIKVLEESDLGNIELVPVASVRSKGKLLTYRGKEWQVTGLEEAVAQRPHIALFSAGAEVSRHWAPEFANKGTFVIDNSSAWRKDNKVPLVVPEINAGILNASHRVIANPNCSTIQLVLVLAPLHRRYMIRRVVVATYQSVTGSGARGLQQLENERKGIESTPFYPHPIDLNLIPQAGDFTPNGYTTEEEKLSFETCKIIGDKTIKVTATAVRVPVYGGHSEAVNVEFNKPFELADIPVILGTQTGITVLDDPERKIYPMPMHARNSNEVFVGRIRRDFSVDNGLNLWIVADNLRKGAATNAVQIAQYLVQKGMIHDIHPTG